MQVNKKKIRLKKIFIVVLIIVFLCTIIPIPIKKEYDAIEIKLDDPSYIVPIQVSIKGRYHWNIFTADMFDGQIVVSDYKLTNEKMSKVYISDDGYPLEYNYTGGTDIHGRPEQYTFFLGRMYSNSWFREMVITVYSSNQTNKDGSWGGWNEQDGYCIIPLVANGEEALNILLERGIIHDIP